ncbi:3-hydroxyanthranilate 3,4-dioxygenase [Malassezia cuniculi]|uniref:3-hydroxyanthranilate 3,4-dioxygenase n=1 Tax=Malassezia cuniculi TaxID=948313 RepID=A0AAF0J5V3_9BASI|nr:3-hydroxyanthranilate 3,4-dioxygenase [Malassezia cuniculi]
MVVAPPFSLQGWISENAHLLRPPVGNKCLVSTDGYFVMVVGGPNERADFHFQPTEELFYQHKGSMLLSIVEDGKFRNITINEGEMFLLPANTPHSPRRFPDTVGLVLERTRETPDACLWYCPNREAHPEPHLIHQAHFQSAQIWTELPRVLGEWKENESLRRCDCGYTAAPVEYPC